MATITGPTMNSARMIRQAGIGAGKGWINPYATGATIANSEASFTLGATITDKSILYTANNTLAWDAWLDFLGRHQYIYLACNGAQQ